MAKLPGNANKKRLNSQDDDSVSHFAPSGLEDESGRDEDNTFAQGYVCEWKKTARGSRDVKLQKLQKGLMKGV